MINSALEERRAKFIAGLAIRAIVCVIFIIVCAITASLVSPDSRSHFATAILILAVLAILNWPFWVLGKHSAFSLNQFYAHWAVDLFLVTFVVHMLGGVELPCGFVGYMIMILTSAVFLSQKASFIVAVGSTICFDGLVLLEAHGVLRAQTELWDHVYSAPAQVVIVLASNVFFFLFAYLAGSLSEELKQANAALGRAQQELALYNRDLQALVKSRTVALEEKNREIEEFVHIVTHDLRNVSVGTVELARRLVAATTSESTSVRTQRYAGSVLKDARRMNSMLTHLLALFKVDHSGDTNPCSRPWDVIVEVLEGFSGRLEQAGIEVLVGNMPDVVAADHVQFAHVIHNLVDNAIKYSAHGEGKCIHVGAKVTDGVAMFEIEDHGVGIPEAQLSRIFQMYHRGPGAHGAKNPEGSGVGLAITKRIVERWGGTLSVDSVEGRGSLFRFTCPLAQSVSHAART